MPTLAAVECPQGHPQGGVLDPLNVTVGSKQQLQAVIYHNITPALVHMLETEGWRRRRRRRRRKVYAKLTQ